MHPAVLEHGLLVLLDLFLVLPLLLVAEPAVAATATLGAVLAWASKGLHRRRISMSLLDDVPDLVGGVLDGVATAVVVGLAISDMDAAEVMLLAGTLLVSSVLVRAAGYHLIRRLRVSRRVRYRTLIVGSGDMARLLEDRLVQHPNSGLVLVGTAERPGAAMSGDAVLGDPSRVPQLIREHGIDDVVVGYGSMPPFDLVDLMRACQPLDVEIFVVPRFFELASLHGRQDRLWDIPLLRVKRAAPQQLTWRLKRLFDVVAAFAMLLLLAPMVVGTAAAVRLSLGPGIVFRQTRIGKDGRRFDVLKFRSMRPPAAGSSSTWSVTSGSRLTAVGRFIRRFSLDELPQLVNVLRGDMSIVGPRPERPEYVLEFSESVPGYGHRHRVPAGLTGLAAVNGLRGDTSIRDRAQFDNWYIENWSLWLDMKIMLRTGAAVFRGTGS